MIKGILFALTAALCYAAMPLLASTPYREGVGVISLLAIRFTLAWTLLCLLPSNLLKSNGFRMNPPVEKQVRKAGYYFSLLAISYFAAIQSIPSGQVALILYLYPLWVVIGEWVFYKKTYSVLSWLGLLLSLIGVLQTVRSMIQFSIGTLLAVLSSGFYAAYILQQTKLVGPIFQIPSLTVTYGVIKTASLVFLLLSGVQLVYGAKIIFPSSMQSLLSILGLAVISSLFSVTLFSRATQRLGATFTSIISTTEPLFTLLLGTIFLSEPIGPRLILGAILVLLGSALFVFGQKKRASVPLPLPLL